MRRTNALIIGGGPAGSAAALRLAALGLPAELIERERGPRDIVCGGFLGWDALALLRSLGVDAGALGARPIDKVRLIGRSRTIEAPLPHAAAGLSRRALDAALLDLAADRCAVRRGVAAREVDVGRRSVRTDAGEIEAQAIVLASGKHETRGARRPPGEGAVGLRCALAVDAVAAASLDGFVELHLFDGGYAGVLLQEDGLANFSVSVDQRLLREAGGLEPMIARLANANPALAGRLGSHAPSWSTIAGVPYGWRARITEPGLFRVGDQAAVISSLIGDGIAIALASGIGAAEALHAHGPGGSPRWQRAFASRAARPLIIADGLRWFVEHGVPRRAALAALAILPSIAGAFASATRIGVSAR